MNSFGAIHFSQASSISRRKSWKSEKWGSKSKGVWNWRKRKKRRKPKFWAISLSLRWIPLGDRSLSCQVEVVVVLLFPVSGSKLLLLGQSFYWRVIICKKEERVDLVWRKSLSRSRILDYLVKLLKEELLTKFSPR